MMNKNALIATFIIFISLFASCDNSLDAFDERALYSIHGYLGIYREYNYIRIKELSSPLRADSTREIDATVTLQNLKTGESEVLKDSIMQFDNVYTHNFRTTLDITPETSYRLTVERSDGEILEATATTPFIAQLQITPAEINCRTRIRTSFVPVLDRIYVHAFLGFSFKNQMYWITIPEVIDAEEEFVYLSFAVQSVLDQVFRKNPIECYEMDTDSLYIKYYHFGPDYFDDTVDDTLLIPGGAGEFKGLYMRIVPFHVDTT
ncbi:MAG TPA: hypothetical protein VF181_09195 [Balneolaceae bacterium]